MHQSIDHPIQIRSRQDRLAEVVPTGAARSDGRRPLRVATDRLRHALVAFSDRREASRRRRADRPRLPAIPGHRPLPDVPPC